MQSKPSVAGTFVSLGQFDLKAGDAVAVTVSTEDAQGIVHADAIQIVPVK
jgi:hypothetical protein